MLKDGWICLIRTFLFMEYMTEEHDLKLIHVEEFGDMQQQQVGIVLQVRHLMQNLVPLVSYARFHVLLFKHQIACFSLLSLVH